MSDSSIRDCSLGLQEQNNRQTDLHLLLDLVVEEYTRRGGAEQLGWKLPHILDAKQLKLSWCRLRGKRGYWPDFNRNPWPRALVLAIEEYRVSAMKQKRPASF
jgi:hypothetical protein